MARFQCKIVECDYASTNFNIYLNHTWVEHSLNVGFSYKCNISDCTSQRKNVQSFRRYLKAKHCWFYEKYVKRYENHLNRDGNSDNENDFNDNDIEQFRHEYEGQDPDHIENISFADFDHNQLIICFLLELREKYGTTNVASCFFSEKVSHILQLENKVRYAMFQESIRRNNPNFVIDHEAETLLFRCKHP